MVPARAGSEGPPLLCIRLLFTEALNQAAMELQRMASARHTIRPICVQLVIAASSIALTYLTGRAILTIEALTFRAIGL